MQLLVIEIDLESFFDINLIVFTTIAFLFSVVVTTILVFTLRPLTAKARTEKGKTPEKINTVYLRLIIYYLAEFIAFMSDIFLVIFGGGYNIPFFTIAVFITFTIYKLVFVLFRDFRDLGFNAKGIVDSVKTATKIVSERSLDSVAQSLDEMDKKEDNGEYPDNELQQNKPKRRRSNMRSKIMLILIFVSLSFVLGGSGTRSQDKQFITDTKESLVVINEPKVVKEDTIILKLRNKPKLQIRVSYKEE